MDLSGALILVKLIKAGIDHNHADVYYPLGLYIASRILGKFGRWECQHMSPISSSS